jgi:ketosteroid isomerase-like protein
METNLRQFAMDLVDSWNSHNLNNILNHYSDDFELVSPNVKAKLNINSGIIKGKENVRVWWERVLKNVPDLSFEFIDIAESLDSFVLIQKSSHNKKITVSNFFLNVNGQIIKEIYFD